MKENKVLFFQDLENFLSPENLENSKVEFRKSFSKFGLHPTIEELEDNIILHFSDGATSSWRANFLLELEEKFHEVQNHMEESYLKNHLVNFNSYVESSLKKILKMDVYNFSQTYISDLLLYFSDKYNLTFKVSNTTLPQANLYHLRNGIKKSDVDKLFILSVDEYIDDSNLELEDFINFMNGKVGTALKFKCTTREMAEYVKQLLFLFEESEYKNVGKLFFFYSKRGTLLTSSNFGKTLSTNSNTISLSKDLLSHFMYLQQKAN